MKLNKLNHVFDMIIGSAVEIGHEGRTGHPLGAIFVAGDTGRMNIVGGILSP